MELPPLPPPSSSIFNLVRLNSQWSKHRGGDVQFAEFLLPPPPRPISISVHLHHYFILKKDISFSVSAMTSSWNKNRSRRTRFLLLLVKLTHPSRATSFLFSVWQAEALPKWTMEDKLVVSIIMAAKSDIFFYFYLFYGSLSHVLQSSFSRNANFFSYSFLYLLSIFTIPFSIL